MFDIVKETKLLRILKQINNIDLHPNDVSRSLLFYQLTICVRTERFPVVRVHLIAGDDLAIMSSLKTKSDLFSQLMRN